MKISKNQTECYGICPSCNVNTSFTLLGIQRWPEKVAKSAGLPLEQSMWQCDNCITSVMGDSILPQSPNMSA